MSQLENDCLMAASLLGSPVAVEGRDFSRAVGKPQATTMTASSDGSVLLYVEWACEGEMPSGEWFPLEKVTEAAP